MVPGIKVNIIFNLNADEVNNAHTNNALACSSLFSLFKLNFKSELVKKFLVCVAWVKQDEVEKPLKTSPELMLEKATFVDCFALTRILRQILSNKHESLIMSKLIQIISQSQSAFFFQSKLFLQVSM